jgi:regulator of sigma E protease
MPSFVNMIISVVLGLLVLGILVIVHELGHFLAAKYFRIRVLAFSIGFGRPLWHKEINGTDYRVCSIPFGGYVHMAGEHPEDREAGAKPDPDEFTAKPTWQRAIVAFAGPAFNFIFALICLWVMFMLGEQRPLYLDSTVIGGTADSSASRAAGLISGDRIVSINGKPAANWDDMEAAFSRFDRQYSITVARGDSTFAVTLVMPLLKGKNLPAPMAGLQTAMPPRIGAVLPGKPADKAGLRKNDLILSINGDTMGAWESVVQTISHYDTARGPAIIRVLRRDSVVALTILPAYDAVEKRFLIGMQAAQPASRVVKYSPRTAIVPALKKAREHAVLIFVMLRKLASREVSPENLSGPIGIVQISGILALLGPVVILNFMALIGINLAVLNLFPLIITDGGLLLFLLIETIRKKPLPLSMQSMINRIAIAFFIALFVYVTFNDIMRLPMVFEKMLR